MKRRKPGTIVSKTAKIHLMERRRQALQFRLSGATYDDIANAVRSSYPQGTPAKYDRVSAYQDVQAELKDLAKVLGETREAVRQLEMERLDALLFALWHSAKEGDDQAIDRVLKIMSRRASLMGLDAPSKVAETDPEGGALPARAIFVGGSEAAFIGALQQLSPPPEGEA